MFCRRKADLPAFAFAGFWWILPESEATTSLSPIFPRLDLYSHFFPQLDGNFSSIQWQETIITDKLVYALLTYDKGNNFWGAKLFESKTI